MDKQEDLSSIILVMQHDLPFTPGHFILQLLKAGPDDYGYIGHHPIADKGLGFEYPD